MYQSSPFSSTLNTGYITALDMCEECIGAGSPFCSTSNTGYITALDMCEVCTGYITALDMCEVCTEAVHSVALWTRVTLQLWTCVKYEPKQSIP